MQILMRYDKRAMIMFNIFVIHGAFCHLLLCSPLFQDLRQIKAELERHVASGQFEVKRLNNELQQLTDQLNRRNADIEKFNCTIQNMKVENQELALENSRNNEQVCFLIILKGCTFNFVARVCDACN